MFKNKFLSLVTAMAFGVSGLAGSINSPSFINGAQAQVMDIVITPPQYDKIKDKTPNMPSLQPGVTCVTPIIKNGVVVGCMAYGDPKKPHPPALPGPVVGHIPLPPEDKKTVGDVKDYCKKAGVKVTPGCIQVR